MVIIAGIGFHELHEFSKCFTTKGTEGTKKSKNYFHSTLRPSPSTDGEGKPLAMRYIDKKTTRNRVVLIR